MFDDVLVMYSSQTVGKSQPDAAFVKQIRTDSEEHRNSILRSLVLDGIRTSSVPDINK